MVSHDTSSDRSFRAIVDKALERSMSYKDIGELMAYAVMTAVAAKQSVYLQYPSDTIAIECDNLESVLISGVYNKREIRGKIIGLPDGLERRRAIQKHVERFSPNTPINSIGNIADAIFFYWNYTAPNDSMNDSMINKKLDDLCVFLGEQFCASLPKDVHAKKQRVNHRMEYQHAIRQYYQYLQEKFHIYFQSKV